MNKKIIFFGTPKFTKEFLDLFLKLGLEIVAIVSAPDKPAGRGQRVQKPEPKIWGEKNGIPVIQPVEIDDGFVDYLAKFEADLFIVIAYGKILPERLIDLPKYKTINLHYSLLPKYRGASPVESAILNGETKTGITIQRMRPKLDCGEILFQKEIDMSANETKDTLLDKLNSETIRILPTFFEEFFSHKTVPLAQDDNLATYCKKFNKKDLDITQDIKEGDIDLILRKYRAFPAKIHFVHQPNNMHVKISKIFEGKISRVTPENRKEISLEDFERSFGKIFY